MFLDALGVRMVEFPARMRKAIRVGSLLLADELVGSLTPVAGGAGRDVYSC